MLARLSLYNRYKTANIAVIFAEMDLEPEMYSIFLLYI